MRILLLDDSKGFREEVKNMLVRHGYEVDTIGSAPAAVPRTESGDYDFVLVDYHMPQFDGVWFMNRVSLPKHTKALLVTAYTNRYVINRMFVKGVSGYIIKPFSEDELIRNLNFYEAESRTEKSGGE